ncbi:MAG: polysaccharide deacetylase family protein [Chthoniobacterales bacterium]
MGNSRLTPRVLLLGFAAAAPVIALALIRTHIVFALAPLFLSHLLLLFATLAPNNQWWGPVINTFRTEEPEVWVTIDDGPSPAHTLQMLDLLDRFEARATFFVIGKHAEQHPHLITEILARGHSVANHTFSHQHSTFWAAGPARIAREIDRCSETLRSTPTRPNLLFRAPVGMKSPFLHSALERRRLALIGWTVRGLDTVLHSAEAVVARVEKGAKHGAIIVLHEGHQTERDPGFSVRCLELTLERLSARGYRFIIPTAAQLGIARDGR